ncbi:MAG: hypothetical protein KUL88_06140 [Rhizobium sp.]|nr:hypothetical protein [Rhizobium sp.]
MSTRSPLRIALSIATLLSVSLGSGALAGTPSCEQVTGTVSGRFSQNMRSFLDSDLSIADFGVIHETRLEPRDETHRVERRYCQTKVTTSDGRRRQLWYLIESPWGFAGLGSSVEFCVSGLDPWHVYGAHCKSLR